MNVNKSENPNREVRMVSLLCHLHCSVCMLVCKYKLSDDWVSPLVISLM